MTPSRQERIVLSIFAAFLICVLSVHFACTLLYQTPPNPIRIALHAPLMRYMHPYLYQSWHLFAPDPGGTDIIIFVRCRVRVADELRETEWFDITTPLHEQRYANRFSPALFLARAHEPHLQLRADPMHEAIRKFGLPNATVDAARQALADEAKRKLDQGQAHLHRIASSACDRRVEVGQTIEVQARYVTRKIPPFAMRNVASAAEESHVYELPWAPHEVVDGY